MKKENRMKVEKTISENGNIKIEVSDIIVFDYYNDKGNCNKLYKQLTGVTASSNECGIFDFGNKMLFYFGIFKKEFNFETNLDPTSPIEEYAARLAERIKIVRDWVESCKRTAGTADIIL